MPCNAEEQTYDTEHRELLNLPPGECVRARPDFPTRAAGWLDAVRATKMPLCRTLPSPAGGMWALAPICAARAPSRTLAARSRLRRAVATQRKGFRRSVINFGVVEASSKIAISFSSSSLQHYASRLLGSEIWEDRCLPRRIPLMS